MASCRRHGLTVCLSQTHNGPLPIRTPSSHSLTLPGAASPSQENRFPLGSASTRLFLPLPRECFPAVPTKLICPPFISSNFTFFLRQIIQLKKSPSIKTCLTSSCLSKTMTFSPLWCSDLALQEILLSWLFHLSSGLKINGPWTLLDLHKSQKQSTKRSACGTDFSWNWKGQTKISIELTQGVTELG